MKHWRRVPLGVALVMLTVASILPASTMAMLRSRLPWFSEALNRIEGIFDGVTSTHVVMFLAIGLLLAWSLPRMRAWALVFVGLTIIAVLGVLSELVQFFVPGRTLRLSDVGADLVGGAAGLATGLVLRWIMIAGLNHWRQRRKPPPLM